MTLLTVPRRRGARVAWADDPTNQWSPVAAAIPDDTTPYVMPTGIPYNVPTPCPTPNIHGSGQAMHPSVLDFHGDWNGYRFWMGMTPLTDNDEAYENPCIMVSHDGHSWVEPPGITNPLDPWPGGNLYNSDTELAYDPDRERLICYWRTGNPTAQRISAAWSTNGTDWSSPVVVIPSGDYVDTSILSPSIIRRGPGDWWMFTQARDGIWAEKGMLVFHSTSPLVWGSPTRVLARISWHAGGVWDGTAFRILGDDGILASSSDGYAWTVGTTRYLLEGAPGEWDVGLYRPTLTVMDDATMRVWYSAHNNSDPRVWRTGYTQIPRSAWPAPPA